ncbi:MAG: hypothetical protein IJC21_00300 [Lentisphaeria bacterium]|nr:hypothetical protein [Lentisphaeria bacterium]
MKRAILPFILLLCCAAAAEQYTPDMTRELETFRRIALYTHRKVNRKTDYSRLLRLKKDKLPNGKITVAACQITEKNRRAGFFEFDAVKHKKSIRHVAVDILHDSKITDVGKFLQLSFSADGKKFVRCRAEKNIVRESISSDWSVSRILFATSQQSGKLRFHLSPAQHIRQLQICRITVSDEPIEKTPAQLPGTSFRKTGLPKYHLTESSVLLTDFLCRQIGEKEDENEIYPAGLWANARIPQDEKQVKYPGTSAARIAGVKYKGFLYRFQMSGDFKKGKEEIFIRFRRSSFITTIYIDGKPVGKSVEGTLPFEINITKFIQPGKIHDVVIKVMGLSSVPVKNHLYIYPVGASAKFSGGIIGVPVIEKRPAVRTESVGVTPSKNQVRIDAEIVNNSSSAFDGKLEFSITDYDGKNIFSSEQELNIAKNSSKSASCTFNVKDELKLWDIGKPHLYYAVLKIKNSAVSIQSRTRFGYRYVEIKGPDFHLNGRHVRMRGPWGHRSDWMRQHMDITTRQYSKDKTPHNLYRHLLKNGMNALRLHRQIHPEMFYKAADEVGILVIAESSIGNNYVDEKAAKEHLKGMVKNFRNHPSIILWSATNEFNLWRVPRTEKSMDFLVKLDDFIKKLDSSRPVQHSGFGDAHGRLDIVNIHYPSESQNNPAGLYWQRNPEKFARRLWKDIFIRYNPYGKKPVFYGEELNPGITLDQHSHFTGVEGMRARFMALHDRRTAEKLMRHKAKVWRYHIRAAREQNVGLISPILFYIGTHSLFTKLIAEEFKNAGAYPVFPDPVFTGGRNETRKFAFFEDDGFDFKGRATVTVKFADGSEYPAFEDNFSVDGGKNFYRDIMLKIPQKSGKANLVTRVYDLNNKAVYCDTTEILIREKAKISPVDARVSVWGNSSPLRNFAAKYNIRTLRETPSALSTKILLVMPDISEQDIAQSMEQLCRFLDNGGRIFFFERQWQNCSLPGNIKFSDSEIFCKGFMRNKNHPVLKNMDDLDFRYWNSDLSIASQGTRKGFYGNSQVLIDCGSKLSMQLLWELFYGRGSIIVNHLELLKNLEHQPQAELLMSNILNYLKNAPEKKSEPAAMLVFPQKDTLYNELRLLGVSEKLKSGKVLLVTPEAAEKLPSQKIISHARNFENVVFFNLPETKAKEIAVALTGTAPATSKYRKSEYSHSNVVFFKGCDQSYSMMTDEDINFDSNYLPQYSFGDGNGWKNCIADGRDAVFTFENQRKIIFINLQYRSDASQPEKRVRFTSQLIHNLGGKLAIRKPVSRQNAEEMYCHVDLTRSANESRERILEMKSGVLLKNGIPFRLPAENRAVPKSVIRLSGHENMQEPFKWDTPLDKFSSRSGKIKVRLPMAQAETFSLLMTATQNWKLPRGNGKTVGYFRIFYRDGTMFEHKIRLGEHVQPARATNSDISDGVFAQDVPMKINPGEQAKLYISTFVNPVPENKLDYCEFESAHNLRHDLLIFSMTLERTSREYI